MLRETYQIITPDFNEMGMGEGYAFRLHRLGLDTVISIEPVIYEPADNSIRRQTWRPEGVMLTWDELMTLLQELEPLLNDFHDCARCDALAAPGRELCPRCQADEERYLTFEEGEPCQEPC